MNGLIAGLLGLSTALLGSAAVAADAEFVARGQEPGWSVRKDADGITFQRMGGDPVTVAPLPAPETVEIYRSSVNGQPFVLTIADTLCVDTMSGMPHPASVTVEIGDERLEGCGGEPAALLHGDWTVVKIDGSPPVEDSDVTIAFTEGGEINGSASCNRYFGSFTLTGESLTVTNAGASMMACEEHLMEQEGLYLAILSATVRFDIGTDGSLVLHAGDGRTIEAVPTAD